MAANIVVDGPKQVDIPKHKVESIGTVAGFVWQFLNNSSPMTLSKLAREIDAPRDLVMQRVGWLAREGKINFYEGPHSNLISRV